jgi:hypothetical protein
MEIKEMDWLVEGIQKKGPAVTEGRLHSVRFPTSRMKSSDGSGGWPLPDISPQPPSPVSSPRSGAAREAEARSFTASEAVVGAFRKPPLPDAGEHLETS